MRIIRNLASASVTALLALAAFEPALSAGPAPVVRARYLMGARCELRAFGPEVVVGPALDAALDRIAALERVLTTWKPEGELAQLNAALATGAICGAPNGWQILSPPLTDAMSSALSWAGRSGGAFDPSLGVLLDAWGQKTGGRVPTIDEIRVAQTKSGVRCVEFDRRAKRLCTRCPGIEFDFGGIGKGMALDEAATVLKASGISSALLDFGGQVLAIGAPPEESGWLIDIADPRDRSKRVLTLRVRDKSVSTSSNSERFFERDGERYGHILDPRTGAPLTRDDQVTVIAARATDADAASTALLVDPGLRERAGKLMPGMTAMALTPASGATLECWADASALGLIVNREVAVHGCQ